MYAAILIAIAIWLSFPNTNIKLPKLIKSKINHETLEIEWMRGIIDALRSGLTPREVLAANQVDFTIATNQAILANSDLTTALKLDALQQNSLLLKALAACWQVSQQHGTALAPALQSALNAQLDRVAITAEIKSQLAGPKTAGLTLALLPIATLALAQVLGISAFRWLITTPIGFGLLVIGGALLGIGTWIMFKLASNIERELQL